jgi:uncharacterized delta-60 repeat protein
VASVTSFRARPFLLVALASLLFSSSPLSNVRAAAGDLDPSFGSGGKVNTDFAGLFDEAQSLAVQIDGKIVAAGSAQTSPSNSDFALVRYNPDGSLDPAFGSGGKVTTDFFGSSDFAYAVTLETSGKIVAAGSAFNANGTNSNFAVARYNANGSLDSSFGSGGKIVTDFFGLFDEAHAIKIQPDGKIVVAGLCAIGSGFDFGLARYNVNGSLDSTFGSGGKVNTDFSGDSDAAYGIALQPDGKIIVAGTGGSPTDFALARYNTDGSLDSTFGVSGRVITDFGGFDEARALALQPNGKAIAAGLTSNGPSSSFALARFNSDGSLDSAFGAGGKTTTTFGGLGQRASAVALQFNGKIVAAGVAFLGPPMAGTSAFALARYNSNGNLDSTFGSGGKVLTSFGIFDKANAVALQMDGRIVAAGSANNTRFANGGDFALARYDGDGPGFDVCLQDDGTGNLLQFNSTTGNYQFTNCSGFTLGGTGAVTRKGNIITLQQNGPDRRLLARIDGGVNKGTASLQVFSQGTTFTITDRNTLNNTCSCGGQ